MPFRYAIFDAIAAAADDARYYALVFSPFFAAIFFATLTIASMFRHDFRCLFYCHAADIDITPFSRRACHVTRCHTLMLRHDDTLICRHCLYCRYDAGFCRHCCCRRAAAFAAAMHTPYHYARLRAISASLSPCLRRMPPLLMLI